MTKEEKANKILTQLRADKDARDQSYIYFRNENLATYTREGRKQFIGFTEKPDWKEDYQYNVFDPITRDKIMAIISKTRGYYEAQFFNTNKRLSPYSNIITNVLKGFYKDSSRRLKEKEKNRHIMLQALTTPKSIWFEGWRYQKRKVKNIVDRDETGKITEVEEEQVVHYNGPYGELIPVEDFIPGSMTERDIQEQPRLTWIIKMDEERFRREFSKYDVDDVPTYGDLIASENEDMLLRDDVNKNEVEVIRYFNKWEDEFHVIANGQLLTPVNNPMPYNHKEYPFVWGGFEELNPRFIYDMPLTIKLLDMQDANNEILNLSLDMLWRALNEVILVTGGDDLGSDVLSGGGLVPVNDPGNFTQMQFGSSGAFNAATNITQQIKASLESSSVSAELAGQSGEGRSKTAREVLVAREAAMEIASLFLDSMERMERDKAYLRVKNQLDRYQTPVEWEKRLGVEGAREAIPKFREISVRQTQLDNGEVGTLNINITPKPRGEDKVEQENKTLKEMSQTIDIPPSFLRQIEFDCEIVANSSIKRSKALEAEEAERYFANTLKVPQMFNVQKAAEEYVKALDKNPEEHLKQQQQQQQQRPQPQQGSEFSEVGELQTKQRSTQNLGVEV